MHEITGFGDSVGWTKGEVIMSVSKVLDRLKKKMRRDRCIEFIYYPRREMVVARIDIGEDVEGKEFLLIHDTLKEAGFDEFWIHRGECDFLEEKYAEPDITFYARVDEVDPELLRLLKEHGGRMYVCSK